MFGWAGGDHVGWRLSDLLVTLFPESLRLSFLSSEGYLFHEAILISASRYLLLLHFGGNATNLIAIVHVKKEKEPLFLTHLLSFGDSTVCVDL